MKSVRAKVSGSGRVSIPSEIRKAIGLERGGEVVVELAGNEIRIRTLADSVGRAKEAARRAADASVDDFIAARREEATRD